MHGDVEVASGRSAALVSAARELQHIISIRGKKRKEGAKRREGATMVIADDDNGAMRMKRI